MECASFAWRTIYLTLYSDQIVLPDDPIIRHFAEDAVRNTAVELEEIKQAHGFNKTYPDQLEALAFLSSVVKGWKECPGRKVKDDVIDGLYNKVEISIERMAYKSRIHLSVGKAVLSKKIRHVYTLIANEGKEVLPEILFTLRRYIDFGHTKEIISSAKIYTSLIKRFGKSVEDKKMLESLEFRAEHPDTKVSSVCKNVIGSYNLKVSNL